MSENEKLPGGPGRPTKKQLDDRTSELEAREGDIAEREASLREREAQVDDAAIDLAQASSMATALPARQSVDEAVARDGKGENPLSIRSEMEDGKKFPNVRAYLEKHKEKQLLWVNDYNGDVQRWIEMGAEPVPLLTKAGQVFEGITDKSETKWVRVVGGELATGVMWVYLMMCSHEVYHRVRIAPQLARQELIRRAMVMGRNQSGEGMEKGFQAYAPFLPSGERGYTEEHETVSG
jgi:hypothetical protein